jgi:hypothetical protein
MRVHSSDAPHTNIQPTAPSLRVVGIKATPNGGAPKMYRAMCARGATLTPPNGRARPSAWRLQKSWQKTLAHQKSIGQRAQGRHVKRGRT